MDRALAELAREAGLEVLLDPSMGKLRVNPVIGRMSGAAALTALLQGSGLGFRVAEPGVFVLYRLPPARDPGSQDGAVAELLVVGRRSQNADIRRAENDVQPYRITTARDLQASHRATIDEYLRAREPADVSIRAPLQDTVRQPARTTSEINLRGLGAERTLVLVDGRRLPGIPTGTIDFAQPDVNGIPVGAVERIEVLTSTAGGIHGPGAVGGVVNITLRRDYRGADLNVTGGVTDRGDAEFGRLEGRIGFTPDGGETDVMLFAGATRVRPLRAGERDYDLRARQRHLSNDPASLVATRPTGNGVGVFSTQPLTLDPELGGTPLGTTYTYLPLDFTGTPAARALALVANAGLLPPGLSDDAAGGRRYLTSTPETRSGLLTVRRRFGERIEAYVDGLHFENRGTLVTAGQPVVFETPADAPGNPFAQAVTFSFPSRALAEVSQDSTVARMTAGLLVQLSPRWRLSADYTIGRARLYNAIDGVTEESQDFASAVAGLTPPGKPALSPLDWAAFRSGSLAYLGPQTAHLTLVNRFSDVALRAAGPGPELPGGPLTVTLLAERRREDVPASRFRIDAGPDVVLAFDTPPRRQTVTSAYMELRAPLTPETSPLVPIHGAELQVAVRHDRTELRFDNDPLDASTGVMGGSISRNVTAFTLGGKVRPLSSLLLRASVATGELPPLVRDLISRTSTLTTPESGVVDAARGGRLVGAEGPVSWSSGGSRSARGEHGRTLAVGLVINPDAEQAPRLSIDYSRIDRSREVTAFPLSLAGLVQAADAYPGRVTREPLTDADRLAGFTAGRVTGLDTRALETGHTRSETLDVQVDWLLTLGRAGHLRVYGRSTSQSELKRRAGPDQPWRSYVGYSDGPLAWRGNAGATWARGAVSVDLNVQHFPAYRVAGAALSASDAAALVRAHGSARVPARTYVDLAASWRIEPAGGSPLRGLEIRAGVQNLLDQAPATIVNLEEPAYGPYGDPRRRRFELTLAGRF